MQDPISNYIILLQIRFELKSPIRDISTLRTVLNILTDDLKIIFIDCFSNGTLWFIF